MKAERKKQIRALVHTVPVLIKAHLVNQAFETEKIVTATFELSNAMLDLLGGKIPPAHIEQIQDIYSDILYKTFNIGIKSGEVKSKSVELNTKLLGSELDREIEIKMPMYFGVKKDLVNLFVDQLGEVLDTVPDLKSSIISVFEKDMDNSYLEGVKEYLHVNESMAPQVAPTPFEEEVEQFEEEELAEELEEEKLEEEEELAEELEEEELEEEELEEEELEEELEEEELEEELEEEEELAEELEEEELEEEEDLENHKEVRMGMGSQAQIKASTNSLDVTAVTAFKVWDKYATKELKELYQAQAEVNKHKDNAQMVYAFNNWLVEGKTPELFIPFEKSGLVKKQEDRSVITKLEKYAKLLKNGTAEKVLRYTLGLPLKKAQASVKKTGVLNKLEAYTKLLKDPEAERVLRYTLGLPVTADVKTKMIGSYEPKILKEKILALVQNPKNSKIIEAGVDGIETIVVDCIVANISNMSEKVAVKEISEKLRIKASNFEELEKESTRLAYALDKELKLKGDCVFIDVGGDYCLTYSYAAVDQGVTHAPKGSEGVLSVRDQQEITSLSQLSKSKTIRDIKKASPKVAAYLNNILTDIKCGRIGVVEGSNKLKANLEDVISEVFGLDGLGYYQYMRDNRK